MCDAVAVVVVDEGVVAVEGGSARACDIELLAVLGEDDDDLGVSASELLVQTDLLRESLDVIDVHGSGPCGDGELMVIPLGSGCFEEVSP